MGLMDERLASWSEEVSWMLGVADFFRWLCSHAHLLIWGNLLQTRLELAGRDFHGHPPDLCCLLRFCDLSAGVLEHTLSLQPCFLLLAFAVRNKCSVVGKINPVFGFS